jgi:hypothetical protein
MNCPNCESPNVCQWLQVGNSDPVGVSCYNCGFRGVEHDTASPWWAVPLFIVGLALGVVVGLLMR